MLYMSTEMEKGEYYLLYQITIRSVICGVPQGTFLGPLLCGIFSNDAPLALQYI